MTKLTIAGTPATPSTEAELNRVKRALGDGDDIFAGLSYRSGGTFKLDDPVRSTQAELIDYDAADDDVVEVVLSADGEEVRRWMSVDRFRREYGEVGTRGADGPTLVSGRVRREDSHATRGAIKWVIKGLNFIGVDVAGGAARKTLLAVAQRIEGTLESKGSDRLYHLSVRAPLTLTPVPAEVAASDGEPLLVFLHGTFSSTRRSFDDLWDADTGHAFRDALAHYRGKVYGFEHRSLTASPIDNALALAQQLPAGARLHLLSHSRGGLVGEYLSRACSAAHNPAIARNAGKVLASKRAAAQRRYHGEQAKLFKSLCDVVADKDIQVDKFIRVACPTNGTALASERIDDILSALVNVMGKVGALANSDLLYLLEAFLFALIREKADPNVLPGIQAMNPRAPLIALLNDGEQLQGELTVIAGDTDGERLIRALLMKGVDALFGSANDLVVNTPSMVRGAPRAEGAAFQQQLSGSIHHLNYFAQAKAVEVIGKVLLGVHAAELTPIARLAPSPGDATRGLFSKPRPVGEISGDKPIVYVVPGVLGSHLGYADTSGDYDRIWLDFSDIVFGNFTELRMDSGHKVRALDVLDSVYGDLMEHLAATHDVVPFPFDWRISLREEAKRLAHRVRQDRARAPGQPVRFLAHSMGGLLVRALMTFNDDNGGVWNEVCEHPDARFLMLGTPTCGSYAAFEIMVSREESVRKLAAADLVNDVANIQDMARRFPGVLQLLPRPERGHDFFDPRLWADLHLNDKHHENWRVPEALELVGAADFHSRLQTEEDNGLPHIERISYIAGKADQTPFQHVIDPNHEDGLVIFGTTQGDGRVPWSTGIPQGVQTYYVNAVHGDLANTKSAFAGITDILQEGRTDRLSTAPVGTRGAAAESITEIRRAEETLYPDEQDLTDAAMGSARASVEEPAQAPVRVSIRHGDLRFSRGIILVGHYQGDSIISAERVLDRSLGGSMRRALELGCYPGAPGSGRYFPNSHSKRPAGGLVVGLGYVGELTPRRLQRNVRDALLCLAIELMQAEPDKSVIEYDLTPLLIGTGAGGISPRRSVESTLRAVREVNQVLMNRHADRSSEACVRFASVEFLDIFADRALDAAHALQRLTGSTRFTDTFDIAPIVEHTEHGLTRASFAEDAGWWQRLQVVEKDGVLNYSLLTDRSLIPEQLVVTEAKQIERLSNQFKADIRASFGRGKTLYEMLLPRELKAQMPDQDGVVLMLDEAAARHPWEMLDERSSEERTGAAAGSQTGEEPLAVRVGLLRQLKLDVYPQLAPRVRNPVAIVVGDPPLAGELPQLPGAREEAQIVTTLLEGENVHVVEAIGQAPDAVFDALYDRAYQVLHLAGHGVCEVDEHGQVKRAGMVMGNGILFDSHNIRQLPAVPDLVFINCCHLGAIHGDERHLMSEQYLTRRSLFASNLATAFIQRGARAVVAAGWEVSDLAAKEFARTFYEKMLSGEDFGDAVREARRKAFQAEPHVNTWGAYQCYGDQAFYLLRSDRKRSNVRAPRMLSLAEVYMHVDKLRKWASAGDANISYIETQLDDVIASLPRAWADDAALSASLGRAYGAIGNFASAITHLDRARAAQGASCTLDDLQQLANYKARYGEHLLSRKDLDAEGRRRGQRYLREAEEELQRLLEFGDTSERLSMLGSLHKRTLQRDSARKPGSRRLSEMTNAYWRAFKLADARGEFAPYPLSNALSGLLIGHWLDVTLSRPKLDWSTEVLPLQQRMLEGAQAAMHEGIWAELALPDTQLLGHLMHEELHKHARQGRSPTHWQVLAESYTGILDKADHAQRDSVLNQIRFYLQTLGHIKRTRSARLADRRATLAALEELHAHLRGADPTN